MGREPQRTNKEVPMPERFPIQNPTPGSAIYNMKMLGQWWPAMMLVLKRIEQRLAATEKRTKRTTRRKAGAR